MEPISPRARWFWLTVVLLGVGLVAPTVPSAVVLLLDESAAETRALAAILLAAAAVAQAYRVWLPNPRRPVAGYVRGSALPALGSLPPQRETTSISSVVHVFAILALPFAVVVPLVVLTCALAAPTIRGRRWYQHLFNLAQYACAVAAASGVWQLGRALATERAGELIWVLASLGAYFVVNTGAVAVMVALVEGLPIGHVWLRGRRTLLPSYLLLMLAGALLWSLWRDGQLLPTGPAVVFGVIALYRSVKHTVLLQQQTIDALTDLADLMDKRDYYTHQHSLRVGQYAERLAARLGQSQDECWLVFLCGRLHDIGKCAVSNDVLLKPGPLDAFEREEMARHAPVGAEMLRHFRQFRVGASYVRAHHEWYDGSGYPDGLARGRIPLGARIIAVADAYDAMTTDRPYRRALPHAEAISRLLAGAGSQWDPIVVEKFVELLGQPPAPVEPERAARPVLAGSASA